ncbi:MAG: sigma-54 dependent transcriptional regulator [Planctomycetota bacterium]|nr:sigma-54 dependent transcriptional regulator [Planctomycetota bacterium]
MSKRNDVSERLDSPAPRPGTVLVCDDDGSARELARMLKAAGHRAEAVAGGTRLARALRAGTADVLLCDAHSAGLDVAQELGRLDTPPAWIELAGFGSIEDAVDAVRRGAAECLQKPCEPEEVLLAVARALEARDLRAENRRLRDDLAGRVEAGAIATRDPRMKQVLATIDAVADTRATVLIEGESGTGKTLLARTLHQRSGRASGPFVEVNCGAIPAGLLESELFGSARGSFTGATKDRPGRFEAADGGTLFLDEIGTASPELQVKLLRVLQDRAFERVGETQTRTADVRVVAATNVDLARAVAEGRFREDLLWRLRVVSLELPPLRERAADLALLTERVLDRLAREHGRPRRALSAAALAACAAHRWPGNVRELEHRLERAVLLARGQEIEPLDLGEDFAPAAPIPGSNPELFQPGKNLKELLEGPEREILRQALQHCAGSRKDAAHLLGIDRTTLFNKMRRHGLMAFPARPE